ncbi:MAG: putative membrane protein [Paraglaciecola sp.]|jgi:putative membrane protein
MKFFAGFMTFLLALLHIGIMMLEMFFWNHPVGQKIFSMTAEVAQSSEVLAMNQGLYNGFLGFGLLWGLISGNQSLKVFLLICITIAGIFGGLTAKISILYLQALPGFITLLLVIKAKRRQAGEARLFS